MGEAIQNFVIYGKNQTVENYREKKSTKEGNGGERRSRRYGGGGEEEKRVRPMEKEGM